MYKRVLHAIHDYRHDRHRYWYQPLQRASKCLSVHRLQALDGREVPEKRGEIRAFVVARNESARLEEFLRYHLALGVDRIFLVDNDSSDATREIAAGFAQVHLFTSAEPYICHMNWIDYLVERYGVGYWCLFLDVDEFFDYPLRKQITLAQLASYLESRGAEAMRCLMLDMYSSTSIAETKQTEGQSLIECCPYFDPEYTVHRSWFLDRRRWKMRPTIAYLGGPRKRVLGIPSWIAKVPFCKINARMSVGRGAHDVERAAVSCDLQGVLFHFKFLSDFIERAQVEAQREMHYAGAREYKRYAEYLSRLPALSFYFEGSHAYRSEADLLTQGCMKMSPTYRAFAEAQD